jgi:16S rRNA (uracil1498-N3)-methyltransferase
MKAPLRVPLERVAEGALALDEAASRYVARVHRLGPGARLVLFDPDRAIEAEAEIVAIERAAVCVAVGPVREASARPARLVTWIQGLGKGDKLDAVVRDATELGASVVVPAAAERSVLRALGDARPARWRRIAVEAARQSGRGDAPRVEAPIELAAALEAHGPARTGAAGFCFDPRAEVPFGSALAEVPGDAAVVLVVGPEGGFTEGELAAARAHGFAIVRLGAFVLRTETVCAAALGALAALG